jgi:hypothetical protein
MAGLVLLLQPRYSQAYVREVTSEGVATAWFYPCITMHMYLGSPPAVLTADQLFAASVRAAATWSYPALACSDLRISVVAESEASSDVGYDSKNVITFRTTSWCRQPGRLNDAGVIEPDCYPSTALAVTSVFKNKNTGEILDADIELNAVDYTWGDRVALPDLARSDTMDFQYAVTHEMGHVIGLDHPCYVFGEALRLYDNTGALEVDCYNNPNLPDAIASSMMYPSVDLTGAKTMQRVLGTDDVQGVCDIYPHVHDTCPPRPTDGGCAVSPGQPSEGKAGLLAGSGLAVALLATWLAAIRAGGKKQ